MNEHLPESLSIYFRKRTQDTDKTEFFIGLRGEIASRKRCPFCRLANAAILESPQQIPWSTGQPVHVAWDPGRHAFSLNFPQSVTSIGPRSLPLGERICLYSRSQPYSERFGRAVDPSGIHPNLIKQWINTCDKTHNDGCPTLNSEILALQSSSEQLLLIDVYNKCIVRRSWQQKYIALSYVWGKINQLSLLKSNFGALTTPYGLQHHKDLISKTIWDAMDFVNSIGIRYLWADSLCLIQDDAEDVARGVRTMGLIYEGAYLTVIAANGSHANAGLPRVQRESRSSTQRHEEVMPGLSLVVVRAVDCYLRASKWATRGWTSVPILWRIFSADL